MITREETRAYNIRANRNGDIIKFLYIHTTRSDFFFHTFSQKMYNTRFSYNAIYRVTNQVLYFHLARHFRFALRRLTGRARNFIYYSNIVH